MIKIIQPWGWTGGGQQELFETLDPYHLKHGAMQKVAAKNIHPKILNFIATEVKPNPRYLFILASNMGAGETWGSNINADRFMRSVLAYEGSDWGISTFKTAGIYKHHANKDTSKSYGDIICVVFASALDGYMDRVESIVRIDREKAAKVGAEDVCQSIDRGEFVSWSMGCRVSYDVCSYCLNQAKTRANYCNHMREYPNQIITADFYGRKGFENLKQEQLGLRICVDNPKPTFFDFSRVWIGAAPEAKTLQKVAGMGIPSAELAEMIIKSSADKNATIEKQIQGPGPVGRTLQIFSNTEPSIPTDVLNLLGNMGLPQALSTTGLMGMVLRPREFQRVVLTSGGNSSLADHLDQNNEIFPPSDDVVPCHAMLAKDFFIKGLAHMLLNLVDNRSAYGPVIRRRMLRVVLARPMNGPSLDIPHVGLSKLSGLYNGYRLGLLEKVSALGPEVLLENPEILSRVYGEAVEDQFSGLSKQADAFLNPSALSYMLYAHGFDAASLMQKNPAAASPFLKQAARNLL